jgi:hypothetical protein
MSRSFALDDLGDITAPVGTEGWAAAIRVTIQTRSHDWQSQRAAVLRMIDLLREHRGWELLRRADGTPFVSLDQFMREREPYGLGYDEPRQREILAHGGDRRSAEFSSLRAPLETSVRGKTNDYRLARLKREYPAIYARYEAGAIPSVRAAAIEAGIFTPEPELRVPREVPKMASKLRRELSTDELIDLIAALAGEEHA